VVGLINIDKIRNYNEEVGRVSGYIYSRSETGNIIKKE
jgi:hypothetical protein